MQPIALCVLPPDVTRRVAVEQAATFGWARYVGPEGEIIGMHTFGASPAQGTAKEIRLHTGQRVSDGEEFAEVTVSKSLGE